MFWMWGGFSEVGEPFRVVSGRCLLTCVSAHTDVVLKALCWSDSRPESSQGRNHNCNKTTALVGFQTLQGSTFVSIQNEYALHRGLRLFYISGNSYQGKKSLRFKEGGKPTPLEIIRIKCYVSDVVSSFLKTKIQTIKILV